MAASLPDVIDEDFLRCPLCCRGLIQPKLLPCFHLFCQRCLQQYVTQWQQKHGSASCRINRTPSLDTYYVLPSTVQAMKSLNPSVSPPPSSDNPVNSQYCLAQDLQDQWSNENEQAQLTNQPDTSDGNANVSSANEILVGHGDVKDVNQNGVLSNDNDETQFNANVASAAAEDPLSDIRRPHSGGKNKASKQKKRSIERYQNREKLLSQGPNFRQKFLGQQLDDIKSPTEEKSPTKMKKTRLRSSSASRGENRRKKREKRESEKSQAAEPATDQPGLTNDESGAAEGFVRQQNQRASQRRNLLKDMPDLSSLSGRVTSIVKAFEGVTATVQEKISQRPMARIRNKGRRSEPTITPLKDHAELPDVDSGLPAKTHKRLTKTISDQSIMSSTSQDKKDNMERERDSVFLPASVTIDGTYDVPSSWAPNYDVPTSKKEVSRTKVLRDSMRQSTSLETKEKSVVKSIPHVNHTSVDIKDNRGSHNSDYNEENLYEMYEAPNRKSLQRSSTFPTLDDSDDDSGLSVHSDGMILEGKPAKNTDPTTKSLCDIADLDRHFRVSPENLPTRPVPIPPVDILLDTPISPGFAQINTQVDPDYLQPRNLVIEDNSSDESDHFYYEIPDGCGSIRRVSSRQSGRSGKSATNRLKPPNRKGPGAQKRKAKPPARLPSDTYVLASDIRDKDKLNDLNVVIPLDRQVSVSEGGLSPNSEGHGYLNMDRIHEIQTRMTGVVTSSDANRSSRQSKGSPPRALFRKMRATKGATTVMPTVADIISSIQIEDGDDTDSVSPQRQPSVDEDGYVNTDRLKEMMKKPPDPSLSPKSADRDMALPLYALASCADEAPPKSGSPKSEGISSNDIPCPQCKKPFALPHGVEQLKTCAFASQLQEVVSAQQVEVKLCGNCDTGQAKFKCFDCQEYLCIGCRNAHQWLKVTRSHKVLTLEELQSGKFQQEIKRLQVAKCDLDQEHPAEFFCIQCTQNLCSACVLNHQPGHFCGPIDMTSQRDIDFIRALTDTVHSRMDTFEGAVDQLTNYANHCEQTRISVLQQLAKQEKTVQAFVQHCFDSLKARVEEKTANEITKVKDMKENLGATVDAMKYTNKFVDQLLMHGKPADIVSLAKPLKQTLVNLKDEPPKHIQSELQLTYMEPPKVSVAYVAPLCGKIVANQHQVAQPVRAEQMESAEFLTQHTLNLELLWEFQTRLDHDKKGCKPTGMSIFPNDDIVLVDDINKKVKIFTQSGELKLELYPMGENAFVDPWDVAVLDNGNIAITDKGARNVKIFTSEGKFKFHFGPHLQSPWGIATNSRREIIVTDVVARKVFVHTETGSVLFSLPHDGSGSPTAKALFKCPEYVCVNHNDDIIVSDFEKHCVVSFDFLGRMLFQFGKKGRGPKEFNVPVGLGVDHHRGNIFITDYNNQRIVVLSRNGQFVCCLTTKPKSGGLLEVPQTLVVNHSGHLVLIDGSRVKVFELPEKLSQCKSNRNSLVNSPAHDSGEIVFHNSGKTPSDNRLSSSKETSV